MQVSLNQSSLDEYLSIIKTFMLQTHQRINQQCDSQSIDPHMMSIIDQASIKLKTQKQQIDILQNQLKQAQIARITFKDMKTQYSHLQKRLNQKADQISILRQTVKTLYQDNQRISAQKEALNKEINILKESSSSLRKKLKKQQEEISNHRNQLKKLTSSTEDKISQYLKQDEQKQVNIKKLASDLQRVKSQLTKKEKNCNSISKKLQELKSVQQEFEKSIKAIQRLQQQNQLLLSELEKTKEKYFEQKSKLLKQSDFLKQEINELKQRIESYKHENKNLINRIGQCQQKNINYQNEIIMRTEKLKEKSKLCKTYSDQINKLVKRIEELSQISDQIIIENQDLSNRCRDLQGQLQQVRTFQNYISKIKGEINTKKSAQLNKLMESLGKLQNHA